MIKDSGDRESFTTGAVRDIQEDKGRCDLLPLDVVSCFMNHWTQFNLPKDTVLSNLGEYQNDKDTKHLYDALSFFCDIRYAGDRSEMLMEVSIHYRDGAKKYAEDNWKKGIPKWSYLSSAVRHYLKWHRGDEDEPHDRAFVWNILGLIWTIDNIKEEKND